MDFSSARPDLADPVNSRAARGPSIPHAVALQALADQALREDVRDLAPGLGSADRAREDLADHAQALPVRCHLRVKLRVRSARQDAHVAETSSIRKRRKAR